MVKTCNRCGRKLTDPTSVERGYGPTCWEKEGKFLVNIPQNEEIETLRKEVKALKELVANLQITPQIPMPSASVPNGGTKDHSEIPVMVGGWDVSELQGNPLFMKMQTVCEVA